MKRFILRRMMLTTESAEVLAESWDDAKAMAEDEATEFVMDDEGVPYDSSIEFIGEDEVTPFLNEA